MTAKPRSEVHRLGLLHRAVHVLVFNSRGEIFLQKRSMTKDREPGKWDSSSSGHVDSGEDYDACAVRELREEIGLIVPKTPRTVVQDRRLRGDGPGICLGLSLRKRRAVSVASRRNRARRMVCAGRSYALDGRKAGGFCERVSVDLVEVAVCFHLVLVLVIERITEDENENEDEDDFLHGRHEVCSFTCAKNGVVI